MSTETGVPLLLTPGRIATCRCVCQRWDFRARCAPAVLGIAIAALAAGCGPNLTSGPSFPSSSRAVAVPAVHGYGNDSVISSQPSANEISFYARNKNGVTLKYRKSLTSGLSAPMGMVTTPDRRLYVANSGDSNVLVYRAARNGPQGPIASLHDDGEVPVNVDAATGRRLVAVSNASTTSGGAGSVSIFVKQKARPARKLRYGSDSLQGEGIAIDSNGNCYWSFNDPKTLVGSIVEFAGCKGGGSLFKTGILNVGGLAFDRSNNLYYVDQLLGIYKCTSQSCSIWLSISGLGGLILPKNINFDNSSPQNLWIADGAGYIDAASLDGVIEYVLNVIGGITNPPYGIAPAPGS